MAGRPSFAQSMISGARVAAAALLLAVSTLPATAEGPLDLQEPPAPRPGGLPFLDSALGALLRGPDQRIHAMRVAGTGLQLSEDGSRVKVSFVFRDEESAEEAAALLPALGADVTARYRRLADAWVPVANLAELGSLPGLMIAHQPFPAFPAALRARVGAAAAGTFVTEGVAAAGADVWHGAGADGTGVTVGIIDTFDHYQDALTAGEVPAASAVGTLDESAEHGTACAEIVHDMAPAAELLLASAGTTTEAAARIGELALAGAQLISSSKQYVSPDGPGKEAGDGTSSLCEAIADARSLGGTLFVQAAGNHATSHWDGTFLDTDRDNYHEFAPGVEVNAIALGTAAISTFLRWDDWPASDQDYDLELLVYNAGLAAWQHVAWSQNTQSGSQPPWEYIQQSLDPLLQYGLAIKRYQATENVFLDLMDFGQAGFEYAVPERSLVDVAACPDALSVAAVDAQDPQYPVEPYSSHGPTYGLGGIPTGGWDQPRISAYANVDTWSYGDNAFNGTSAAAPHVAGAVALVMQQHPDLTPDQVQEFLEARAIDVDGTPVGYDHESGAGRLFLGAAGACPYLLTPDQTEVPDTGGAGSFDLDTEPGCPWTAVSNDAWLTVTDGAAGTGDGAVSYSVDANGGAARSATITAGDATFTVHQASAPCSYELSATSVSMSAEGGPGSVDVTTNIASCEWTAAANDPWITITGGESGTGNGTVTFTVDANLGAARTGTLTAAGQTFTVNQEEAACTFTLEPTEVSVSAAAGNGSVAVTANLSFCEWTAVANDPWLAVTDGAAGTGNGTVSYSVAANEGEARSGTITIGGVTFTVNQAAAPCTFALSAPGASFAAAGGAGSVGVTTNLASCEWTAAANDSWITITSGAAGTGNGSVEFSVAENEGEARIGTITVAGQTYTVEQAAAPCEYALAAPGASFDATGGAGSVAVDANLASCPWSAASNDAWITVTGGASGSGDGTVTFSVAANAGEARTGTLVIAGLTFTVDQAAVPCSFTLGALSAAFTAAGGNGNVTVTTNRASCGWTAVSNVAWITVTAGAAGTGGGTVSYAVAANAGAARTGTITIGGQTFTVLQNAAGCTYALYSYSSTFTHDGGPRQTRVWTNQPTCTWHSFSNAPAWVTITGGQSGTGIDFVSFTVAANPGPARQGTLTVAGYTYTVFQDGAPCSYALSSSSADVGAEGGGGSVSVTTSNPSCTWTSVSNAPVWLTVTSGASGAGNGTVTFATAANSGDIRTGTLTIAGHTFTVNQASPPCEYAIAPGAASFAAIGGPGTLTVTCNFASCGWTAASNAPAWLTITSGATGSGSGAVSYTVADNPGEPRSGTLTIAGFTFTVSQGKHGPPVRRGVRRGGGG